MSESPRPKIIAGVLLMTGATLTFASMHGMIRLAAEDIHPFQVAFFRWLFGAIFMLPFIIRIGPQIWTTTHRKLYIFRAVMTTGATLAWFYAISILPLAQATALNFTIPLFTTFGAAIFLGEYVGKRRWTATLIGFLGVLIVLQPGVAEINWISSLPVVAAVFVAANLNIIKFAGRTDATSTIIVYNAVLSTPLIAIPAIFVWQTPSWQTMLLVIAVGFLATIAHFMLTSAFKYGDASALIPLDYLRLPFIAVIGIAFFSQTPDIWTWIGGGVIAGSTIYIAHRESKLARQREDVTEKGALETK